MDLIECFPERFLLILQLDKLGTLRGKEKTKSRGERLTLRGARSFEDAASEARQFQQFQQNIGRLSDVELNMKFEQMLVKSHYPINTYATPFCSEFPLESKRRTYTCILT